MSPNHQTHSEWATNLPPEILYALSGYLSSPQLVALSQVSNGFRTAFKPISWHNTVVIKSEVDFIFRRKAIVNQALVPPNVKYRLIPLAAFLNIEKYSWIDTTSIYSLMLDIWLFNTTEKPLLDYTFVQSQYPNLDRILIDNGLLLAKFFSLIGTQGIDYPNHLLSSSFFAFKNSKLYSSFIKNYPSKKSPFDSAVEVNIYEPKIIFNNLAFFQDVKNLNLDFPSHLISNNFTLPKELVLPNVEFLGIHNSPDLVTRFIVDQLPKWPKIREMEATVWLTSKSKRTQMEKKLTHFQRLPPLSLFKLIIVHDDHINQPSSDLIAITPSSSVSFVLPQLTHLDTDITLLKLPFARKISIEAPNLKHLRFPVLVSFDSFLFSKFNLESITSLNVDMSRASYSKSSASRKPLSALRNLGKLKNLKRLVVRFNELHNRSKLEGFFYSQLRELREYYKDNSNLAPSSLISKLGKSKKMVTPGFDKQAKFNHSTLKKIFSQLFTNDLDFDEEFNLLGSQIFRAGYKDEGLAYTLSIHILDIALLEIITQQLFELESIKYFAIDFAGVGFLSPGLQRVISHHKTIEQVLLNVLYADVESGSDPDFQSGDVGYYCLPLRLAQDNMLVVSSEFKNDLFCPDMSYNPEIGAQVIIDPKGKHKFHPNNKTTFTSLPIRDKSAVVKDLVKSDKSHIFVLPQNLNSMTNEGEFVDFGELPGWI